MNSTGVANSLSPPSWGPGRHHQGLSIAKGGCFSRCESGDLRYSMYALVPPLLFPKPQNDGDRVGHHGVRDER